MDNNQLEPARSADVAAPDDAITYADGRLTVHTAFPVEGGGLKYRFLLAEVLRKTYPARVWSHALDWCSGAGPIGFHLFEIGLAKNVSLLDAYQPALDLASRTVDANELTTRVSIHHGAHVNVLPTEARFDLVVGNPPFCARKVQWMDVMRRTWPSWQNKSDRWSGRQSLRGDTIHHERIGVDPEWRAHRDFFQGIGSRLTPDGVIALVEHGWCSHVDDFAPMITRSGLRLRAVLTGDDIEALHRLYVMIVER
jgi:methylase of polypeptide subunit release factors